MSDSHDAGPHESLTDAQHARLQLTGFLSSSLSLLGSIYVLVHFGYMYWCKSRRSTSQQPPVHFQRNRMDLMAKLVFVLALFDFIAVAARAVGRSTVDDVALCRAQAAVIQVANLASCIWICCIAFNLHRWIAGGESDATRQKRFPLFLTIALLPGAGLALFHLLTDKYGDATYYCWLDEIRYMFLNFYLFYLLMIVFNFVLLALIHFNMKQRVARHDTVEADTSSMLIRHKLLLYIVVFIVHRTPMMVYRIFEAGGLDSLDVGLAMQVIQDLNGFSNAIVYGGICRRRTQELPLPREFEAESMSSPTESVVGGCGAKKCADNERETMVCSAKILGSSLTQSGRKISCGSESGSAEDFGSVEPKKISIFTSTFNMGEKNVNEHELRAWVPFGHDIYVIGVQECMDLADLQIKILRHLVSGSTTSDSSSLKRTKRKKSMGTIIQALNAGDSTIDSNLMNANGLSGGNGEVYTQMPDDVPMEMHQPPSKLQRRNQDAMEILQQLYLDEEDYGFGFPHLHHHSFILGDFNYRLARKSATPTEMLELLVNASSELQPTCDDVNTMRLSSPYSALFDRAEHVEFGFLFPLPCEDVFAPQRKLHEVAEHLTFGGADNGSPGGMGFASTITPTSNFHTLKWHEFVNGGLRYHTLAGPIGRKHVAVVLRSLYRGRSLSKTSSASRLMGSSASLSPHTSASVTSMASTCSPTPRGNSTCSSSSFSSEKLFGHGTFCAEGMSKKSEVCVPLTLGGRLLGRLQLRVSLQMRQKK
ncbi:hypothetical protein PHYBOEH_001526 [Phytophthora boehmeriae]|uniref:G-protein coupled receptors family 2 profile 2 domain-containing protein n=1 Tax=Phytophthora boehmeriae TaxID=109152 RepID=A0A8T1WUW2_9STRA|nr:hypothetical protein PHYBOEH_001526 [Phytophthora boehmeriae]